MTCTLYLIRGVPGSGKSTLAKKLLTTGLICDVFEADQWFDNNNNGVFDASKLHQAHKACQLYTELHLKEGNNIAVSNTSTTENEVEVYRKIAEKTGAEFVSIIVENRHGGINKHNVPEEKIELMKKRFSIRL